jgi:CHAD domain-containing protein
MPTSTADVADAMSSETAITQPPLGMRLMLFTSAQLQQAQAELAREGEARHDGIHQARKCIRRTRATLALGASVFGAHAQRLDDELGRLCRGLSHLRDAQALIEVLHRLDTQAPASIRAILPAAERLARQRRDDMLERALTRDPALIARYLRLQTAQQRLARLDWRALDEASVCNAIKHSQRRADKAAKQVKKHPQDDDAWHTYRRRLRRLRQQDAVLNEMLPKRRLLKKRHRDLADSLGESQDDALLLRHCGRRSPFAADQRIPLRTIARERLQRARSGDCLHHRSRSR